MSDSERIAQMVNDMVPYISAGSTAMLLSSPDAPRWLVNKNREERAMIIMEVQRIIDVIGGIGVLSTYAADTFEKTTVHLWNVRKRVGDDEPDRQMVVDAFVDALTGVTREGMLNAVVKGRNQLLTHIDKNFTRDQQRGIIARIFGE